MRYLLDTDHISILQRQAGSEFTTLRMRMAQYPQTEFAFSIISMHFIKDEPAFDEVLAFGRALRAADRLPEDTEELE